MTHGSCSLILLARAVLSSTTHPVNAASRADVDADWWSVRSI